MNFDLSEEQELFRSSVERFTASMDGAARRRLRTEPGGYSRERWTQLAELGLLALAASEDAGGMGGSPVDLVVVAEALGKANAPDPWIENGILPVALLAAAGRPADLATAMTGERFFAFAFAERGQRYNLVPKSVTARSANGGYALNGEKTFVLGGAQADTFIVSAVLEGQAAYFLVPADASGLAARPYRIADGSLACELRLTHVAVTPEDRLELDSGQIAEAIALVRLLAAAEMLGLAQRLFDDTLAYVKQREQFGVPIGSFQALQHRLVDCYAALEQSRSIVLRAALVDEPGTNGRIRAAAGAKAFVATQADLIAREAVQMHGGMGVTDELAIGHAMKRVLMLAKLFGDEETALAEYAVAA
ncbi:acyl-CoA dehydrogenase family protein [Novosphingobium tardum]|uniref:Acyl-CoA dehydrogenase family protein n=1 Tax=Novosphingobium tardum TaxID=1538021 RepID=A0ABV8RS48_9SPHN